MFREQLIKNEKLDSTMCSCPLKGVNIVRVSTVPIFFVEQLRYQIEKLGQAGANVTVISSDGSELELLGGLPKIRCVTIEIARPISLWLDLSALFRLFMFFRRENIQIAHSTTPKAGLIMALAAFFAGVPIRLHTFTGQPWVKMCGIKRWLARRSDRLIGYLNTRCYADGIGQRKFLLDQKLIDKDHLFVIGAGSLAGVDIQRFDPERFTLSDCTLTRQSLVIPKDVPVILFIGRITVDKGVRDLLQAFKMVKATINDAHLLFVGKFDVDSGVSGGEISRNEIERLPDTHIIGHSKCPERYIAIADILCLPSYREGFGTAVIEAAAMGVPTIGTNIYGLSDAVVHGETGLLVPPYNAQELAKAISLLLSDRALRDKMGKAAKLRLRTLFNADVISKLVINEYVTLLKSKYVLR